MERGYSTTADKVLQDISKKFTDNTGVTFDAKWLLRVTWNEMAYPANPAMVCTIFLISVVNRKLVLLVINP